MAKIKQIKTISSFVLIFLMAIVLLVTLIPHLFGLNIAVIRDNAMQGSLPNGSLVFVKTTPVTEIQVGDLITYYRGEILFWIAALTITFTTITTLIRQSRPLKKQDDPWLFEDKEQ